MDVFLQEREKGLGKLVGLRLLSLRVAWLDARLSVTPTKISSRTGFRVFILSFASYCYLKVDWVRSERD